MPDRSHPEASLVERVAALEESIAFNSLPLRKLRDFMENEALLDGKQITGGTITGDTFNYNDLLTNPQFIDLIAALAGDNDGGTFNSGSWFMREHGWIPSQIGNIGGSTATETNTGRVYCHRILPHSNKTLTGVRSLMTASATSSMDIGIYSDGGSGTWNLMDSTGVQSIGSGANLGVLGWDQSAFTFGSPIDLTGGEEYILASLFKITSGNVGYHFSGMAETLHDAYFPGGAVTNDTFLSHSMGFRTSNGGGGGAWTALPSSLSTGVMTGTAHQDQIVQVLLMDN